MVYGAVLQHAIYEEMAERAYAYSASDQALLQEMLDEVNQLSDYKFSYLCELRMLKTPKGCGEIYMRYFPRFESQSIKYVLASEIAYDVGKKGADIVWQGYLSYKQSAAYQSSPAISTFYDNAFRRMKPKKLKAELMELALDLQDFYYLPFTMRMLASWKIPEFEDVLWRNLNDDYLSKHTLGLEAEFATPDRLEYRRNQVKFTALEGLKYYPSERYIRTLQEYEASENKDFSDAAKKLKKYLEKHNGIVW